MDVEYQAISWYARDHNYSKYLVSIFGRNEDGKSVCITTQFNPYFFVKVNRVADKGDIIEELEKRFNNDTDQYSNMVKRVDLVKSKDLWGFQNNSKHIYVKITCNTQANMKKLETACHKLYKNRVYEANIEPFLRLMHRTGIKSTGWLRGSGRVSKYSNCDIDLYVNDWKTLEPVDRDDIAPFKIVSFDIETNSSTGKFPDPMVEGDAMFQVALTTKLYGRPDIVDKVCLCYKETHADDVVWYDSEAGLIKALCEKIIELDPDVLTGYNIFGFDLEYIWKRAMRCHVSEIEYIGRLKDVPCSFVEKRLSSGALGDNMLKMVPMNGRYVFDLFHEIKREKKLDSYSLNNVSKLFLGDTKIDMSAKEMFRRYREEDPKELGEVAEYCLKDTLLPHRLIDKLCIFTNLVEMAKATWVPLSYLSERAQQIKVFSQITRKARELDFMVPTIKRPYRRNDDDDGEKYEGATVLEAAVDAYYTPVTALDFASLYPSIMMAHNMCFSSIVRESRYMNVPGVEYEKFTIRETSRCIHCRGMGCENCDNTGSVTADKDYYFAQGVPSLLPAILDELKQFRKKAKKLMAEARGTHMEEVYNGQQLAYKISMNSIYGFCGAKKGILPCVPIAASVTCQGRNMIAMTKKCVEENFEGAKVRYGDTDSVMVEFDCKGMSQEEAIAHSWKIGEEAAEMCNKLFKKPNDLELEKVYCPYILYSKKRYAAKMWTQNRAGEMEMEKIDVKGLQLVRRDNTPYTREVSKEVLECILESSDPSGAIELAKQRAQELMDGKVPMEKLVMSKSLADSYKVKPHCAKCVIPMPKDSLQCSTCGGTRTMDTWKYKRMMDEIPQPIPSQPHVHVIEKMNARNPGSHPHTGDRVPFVIVKHEDPKAKMFQKAEDPGAVTPGDLDYTHYFTNQLKKPVEDLLEPLIKGEDIFRELLPPKVRKTRTSRGKQQKITDLFKDYNP